MTVAISIGDCPPAAIALDAATSCSPHTRELLRATRGSTPQWLGVHVPREASREADILSHPGRSMEVWCSAILAGLTPHWAEPPPERWHALRKAIRLPTAASQLGWGDELGGARSS